MLFQFHIALGACILPVAFERLAGFFAVVCAELALPAVTIAVVHHNVPTVSGLPLICHFVGLLFAQPVQALSFDIPKPAKI